MTVPKNSKSKPKKPHKNFPLFPHASGQWAKKVNGKLYYFGVWENVDTALDQWLKVKDELVAGRTPVVWDADALTVSECLNLALDAKQRLLKNGEISAKTFSDYLHAGKLVVETIDRDKPAGSLRPHDFSELRKNLADGRSLKTLRNLILRIRVLFNWCRANDYISKTDVLWGTEFAKPSDDALRDEKDKKPKQFIEAARIRQLISDAPIQMRAMILLGINCGYGAADCTRLTPDHFDADWIWLPRGKKGRNRRRAKLWIETREAIESVLTIGDGSLVFRTKYGSPWSSSAIGSEFAKLRRSGESFGHYWLRHTFLTVAEETKDFEAVRAIMGHVDASMAGQYRESISDQRLQAVTDFVRAWLG